MADLTLAQAAAQTATAEVEAQVQAERATAPETDANGQTVQVNIEDELAQEIAELADRGDLFRASASRKLDENLDKRNDKGEPLYDRKRLRGSLAEAFKKRAPLHVKCPICKGAGCATDTVKIEGTEHPTCRKLTAEWETAHPSRKGEIPTGRKPHKYAEQIVSASDTDLSRWRNAWKVVPQWFEPGHKITADESKTFARAWNNTLPKAERDAILNGSAPEPSKPLAGSRFLKSAEGFAVRATETTNAPLTAPDVVLAIAKRLGVKVNIG